MRKVNEQWMNLKPSSILEVGQENYIKRPSTYESRGQAAEQVHQPAGRTS
jgi:hypothetical protein